MELITYVMLCYVMLCSVEWYGKSIMNAEQQWILQGTVLTHLQVSWRLSPEATDNRRPTDIRPDAGQDDGFKRASVVKPQNEVVPVLN
jgi:hypothetical protein